MKRAALLLGLLLALLAPASQAQFVNFYPSATTTAFTLTGITLSNNTFPSGSATGTVVGAITVQATGGTFGGSLSLSGADAASFQLSGTNLETNGSLADGAYSINIVATQGGAVGSPFSSPKTISSTGGAGTILTTFTFVNDSGNTMPVGQMVSFGQAFPRGVGGFNPASNCVKIRNAADHTDLVYQLDEIATRRENSDDNTVRHLVWSAQWPSTLADGATGQVEFVTTGSACGSPAQKQSLAALASAHDINIRFTDVRNQDAMVRDSGAMTFDINAAAANTGRDAPRKYAQGPVRDGWIVRGQPVYDTSGNKDPLIYVTCFLDLTTLASDQTSLGTVRHTCRVDNPWQMVAAGSAGRSGSPGPVGFANDPQAISYRPELKDGSTSLLDWSWLDGSATSASNPINTSTGVWTIPQSTGTGQWYYGQAVLYSTAGTPPTGMTNNKIYFVCPCDSSLSYDGDQTHISLWDAPFVVNSAINTAPSSQGSGTQSFSYRVWHSKWIGWHTVNQNGDDNWTNGSARAVWKLYPALTDTEASYWANTGMVPPIDRTQTVDTNILSTVNYLSYNINPASRVNLLGGSGGGARPDLGIINEWASQAWISQTAQAWERARAFTFAGPAYQNAVILNEATGYIPPTNNGPPTGPGGNGVGGSYTSLGAVQPLTYLINSGDLYDGVVAAREQTPSAHNGWGGSIWGSSRSFRNDHNPAVDGLQYLLFGNRHYLEMIYLVGNRANNMNYPGGSEGSSRDWTPGGSDKFYGLCIPVGEPRSGFWCGRDKQNAAAFGGDSNPERVYFNDQLIEQNNFWLAYELWKDGGSAGNFTNGMFYEYYNELQNSSFMGTYAAWSYYMGYTMLHAPLPAYSLSYRLPRYWLATMGDLPSGLSSFYGASGSYCRDNARKTVSIANPYATGANVGGDYSTDPADQGTCTDFPDFTASSDTLTLHNSLFTLTNGDKYKTQSVIYGLPGPDELDPSTWYTVSNVNNTTHTFKLINPATGTPFTVYTIGGNPYSCASYCGIMSLQYSTTGWWLGATGYAPYAQSSLAALKILGHGGYTISGRSINDAYTTVQTRGPDPRGSETALTWDPSVVVP